MNSRSFFTQVTSTILAAPIPTKAHAHARVLVPAQVHREHRSILLVIMEQFQHNVASFVGGPAKTPNLEKFATEAVNFQIACTTTKLCSPERGALRTGRTPCWTALLLMLVVSAWFSVARAQTTTGSIYGRVADSTGAVIPNVAVTLTNTQTSAVLKTTTNDQGAFVFPVVDPGDYKVAARASGFSSVTQTGIVLAANQNINASFKLPVGAVSNQVTVEAGVTMVDTRESQIGETISQRSIQALPTVNRSAYDLVATVAGVTKYNSAAATGDNQGVQFVTNGIRPNYNSFYLDGALNNEIFRGGGAPIPNPDALQEFRMLTSNFDAEFGRYPGAAVNIITRSGVNRYHGTAYDYLRNNVLNAKPYFQTSVPRLVQNVYGAGFGGALKRDKFFYFLSFEGQHTGQSQIENIASIIVPTALERQGDFTQVG